MDAPKCRLCDKRHYGQCVSFGKAGPPAKKTRASLPRSQGSKITGDKSNGGKHNEEQVQESDQKRKAGERTMVRDSGGPSSSAEQAGKTVSSKESLTGQVSKIDSGLLVDGVCPTCGTNLDARNRERDRRRGYMRERRKK